MAIVVHTWCVWLVETSGRPDIYSLASPTHFVCFFVSLFRLLIDKDKIMGYNNDKIHDPNNRNKEYL